MSFQFKPQGYDYNWPKIYNDEVESIFGKCKEALLSAHHIGSTAVAGLMAKPVIDILLEVKNSQLDHIKEPLEKLGFISKGEYGIAGRSYFVRVQKSEKIKIHVHAFEKGHIEISKQIAFRNYLIAHQEVADQYQKLKLDILVMPEINSEKYQELKSSFIIEKTKDALAWNLERNQTEKVVKKAVIYGLRISPEPQVLVFDHVQYPEVSPQLPSGTIESEELILEGACREFFEEAGIAIHEHDLNELGSYLFYKSHNRQIQERFCFSIDGTSFPESWFHTVTGTGADQNLKFHYYWMPISKAKETLKANLGDGLKYFEEKLILRKI